MLKTAKVLVAVCVVFLCCGGMAMNACGDWSEDLEPAVKAPSNPVVSWNMQWKDDPLLLKVPLFTKAQFFIVEGAKTGVTFQEPTSVTLGSKLPKGWDWESTIVNPQYSLLTGNISESFFSSRSFLTTYFSGPSNASFELDVVLWNGDKVVARDAFYFTDHDKYLYGMALTDTPGNYNQSLPIPPTILLFGPGALGVLFLRKRTGAQ